MTKTKNMRKRSRKGGDTLQTLATIKTKNAMILADVDRLEGNCDVSDIKDNAKEGLQLINALIDEQREKSMSDNQSKPTTPVAEEESIPVAKDESIVVAEENKVATPEVIDIMKQIINVNGFNGTVGELLSKIRAKIVQLKRTNNSNYKNTVDKLNAVAKNISMETSSIENVKKILKENQITFKNNLVFGGKTKKRQNKKTKRQTKRR